MQCDSAPYDSSDMQFETGQQEKSMQVRACGQVIDHENFWIAREACGRLGQVYQLG